ncbi:MAG: hypothetical protein EOQ55_07345 [Mesorhizobium sp.]|uniref:hypothetical protein n=1 Tax=unclassified Mesorhizobium TaxID=325217 RepID=UPI000FCAA234|nr:MULTISPECIES: hypothetical protein [unclassified Mesorhizobium]RUV46078.1 hypothetical protein EOD29_04460 [Mesorhizobium sp. M1A.T.Ca.IN.004.03.1.1]RUW55400.1 hypothetical protein EOA32_01870 [Mesorhizobium sp. M1A.F.Ca.ET.072.01.1.1]RWG21551.1 MAG: hypothetical protein EOQ55_07345 [Mesorhizobium sp.]RWI98220.1 MAG: hypothetical protein EOR21_03970 [Mesorhizobium sp.]RWK39731.1 MAG: hypothetical protein EOR40_02590 [Mesorhizobium sp.]
MVLSICVALAANGRNIGQASRRRQLGSSSDFIGDISGQNQGRTAIISNAERKPNATFTILT